MNSCETEQSVSIRILRSEGCPTAPQALELTKKVAADLGVKAVIEDVLIVTQEQADHYRFLGSPTVQINGVDVDTSVRDIKSFGFM